MPRNVADRMERVAAQFPDALGDGIGHIEDLIALLIEQKMIIAEMGAAHVPVEIFRLQVDGEGIRQEAVEGDRDFPGRSLGDIGAGAEALDGVEGVLLAHFCRLFIAAGAGGGMMILGHKEMNCG